MASTYITITENNKKVINNIIGICRMNGMEKNGADPSFTFKDVREDIGEVMFDLFYREKGMEQPCWSMTVKVDSSIRFHDDKPTVPGEIYCYLDSYKIEKGSLELKHKTSKFNVFSF
ncbi:MAG: hypothetical protein LUF92_07270 [Clostridiales bacterium]|nr:hypothetical protein [Clostridiales bacterium]